MPAVHLVNVSFRYSSAVAILDDVSLSLGGGWTGIVGANGAGKTTILRLVTGALSPATGSVVVDPADAVVVSCPQTAEAADAGVVALAGAWDGPAGELRGRLRLEPDDLNRWDTLSPGERKRWQIGAALYRQPDVLLLDEPTNHLDTAARALLRDALVGYAGTGLLVSHDRRLLNLLCRRVVRVERGVATLWHGDYDTARGAWEAERRDRLERYREVQAERRKVKRRLADKRRTNAEKSARHRRSLRTAGSKDKDARSMEKKGRFESGQRRGSQDMMLLRDEARRLEATAEELEIDRDFGGDLAFEFEPARKRVLLGYTGPLSAGGALLAADVDVTVAREDRIRLAGPNGAGKSTLLRALLEHSRLPVARVTHLPQELDAAATAAVVAMVRTMEPTTRGRVLGVVARLGSDPRRILATSTPSPGEARKLLIALGIGRGSWVLLLDEPTNHLDLPSIERMERALVDYPGALVLVTHDDEFAAATTATSWWLERGRLSRR
jgi:ATPase subunit of ABC transporter with duplicated ATPase domains